MNLQRALEELTKKPKPMVTAAGKAVPALQYTEHTHSALRWLCERYNDGTLQVIGYDHMEETRKKKLATHDKRRNNYIPNAGEMKFADFVKNSGIGKRTAKKMALEADALFNPCNFYLYIDVPKFYKYWNDEKHKSQQTERYVNLSTAAEMLGIMPFEAKQLCLSGEITRRRYDPKARMYYISVNSINEYLKRKGEENGENNTNDGEVH